MGTHGYIFHIVSWWHRSVDHKLWKPVIWTMLEPVPQTTLATANECLSGVRVIPGGGIVCCVLMPLLLYIFTYAHIICGLKASYFYKPWSFLMLRRKKISDFGISSWKQIKIWNINSESLVKYLVFFLPLALSFIIQEQTFP